MTRTRRLVATVALVAAGLAAAPAPPASAAGLPPPPACPGSEQYPTADAGYGIPIANRIVNGTLTQGSTEISNINATVCGILQFPSLGADIPAADITYQNPATLTAAGIVSSGQVYISASGPSIATTSSTPAPNGGLIFTLTASTESTIDIGAIKVGPLGLPASVQCNVSLSAVFTTDPSKGGVALVGPLTGAQGTMYAPDGQVAIGSLTPANPGDPADATFCPILSDALGTNSHTNASFKAPLDFYSTLTSLGG
ncbi:MAG: hypothetical protein M0Z42_16895 [Actinomycetota bacterium]|nr:hypothetical protein [Actinomycetota bacterium]